MPAGLPLVLEGFAFGWSVAWTPGPINAEIARRTLTTGVLSAFAVALGAASGDATWALVASLGAGLLFQGPAARLALGAVSTLLLLALAVLFLRGAWHGYRARHRAAPRAPRLERGRFGYALGLGMALTSPWNLGFWLAVMGRPELAQKGLAASLVVAGSVVTGALAWCLCLVGMLSLLRIRIDLAWWEIAARGATGLLMLVFAIGGILRLAAG